MAFEFIKKLFKRSSKNQQLEELMEKLNSTVFPGGNEQILKEAKELSSILNVSQERIIGTCRYACVRLSLGNCTKQTLIDGIKNHDKGLSHDQVLTFARYIFARSIKQKLGIDDETLINSVLEGQGFIDVDGDYDMIPSGVGEFGLVSTNPIPVNGVPCNEVYLGRLMTDDEHSISWERRGSCNVKNINMPVDIYDITDDQGNARKTIYISSYHPRMSNIAPKGYVFK